MQRNSTVNRLSGVSRRLVLKGMALACGSSALASGCGPPSSAIEAEPTTAATPTVPTDGTNAPIATASATAAPTSPIQEATVTLGGAPTPDDFVAAAGWLRDRFLPSGGKLPFAFVFDGRAAATLLPGWQFSQSRTSLDAARTRESFVYREPGTGLEVRAEVTIFHDFPAVEWVLYLKNNGSDDTPILEEILPLDAEVSPAAVNSRPSEFVLHHANGSMAQPTDFAPKTTRLGPDAEFFLGPNGGRSSDGALPFFNVEAPGTGGTIVAIGWSGQWRAAFARVGESAVRVRAGMERTHLRLHPGEEIRTPRILLLFWSGERLHGQNLLRRLILAHYTPTQNGKRFVGPIWASSTGDVGFNSTSEENQLAGIAAVKQNNLPLEYWQMDAGWYVTQTGRWQETGTWKPDPTRFPNGLRPVGDAAKRAGLGYILWFEPERVMPNTQLRLEHPEWLLEPSDLPGELAYQQDWRLLNLGDPAALEWVKRTFSDQIREYGVDIYRHDFNMHPLYYWRTNEPADRQGVAEIRYIEGLYDYWDYLIAEHPGLVIDNSASGGRRLDLETISRSVPLFRTDHFWDPRADQDMTHGLSYWLPVHAQGVHMVEDTYTFRSGMGTSVCLAYNFGPDTPWSWLRAMLAEYASIREYFYGDYFPLASGIVGDSIWMAYQFDRDDLGGGMVLAFRREGTGRGTIRLKLVGLRPDTTYEIVEADSGARETRSGASLLNEGIDVVLDRAPQSALRTYRSEARS